MRKVSSIAFLERFLGLPQSFLRLAAPVAERISRPETRAINMKNA
jgi:hypothetical protein